MRLAVGILGFCMSVWVLPVYANSYLDMITQKPDDGLIDDADEVRAPAVIVKNNLWYDGKIKTASPVVVSPYPRYYAWLKAQERENSIDDTHEQIQNLIYVIEGGLVGWGLYEIYKY